MWHSIQAFLGILDFLAYCLNKKRKEVPKVITMLLPFVASICDNNILYFTKTNLFLSIVWRTQNERDVAANLGKFPQFLL
jgi:hypothetical protein